MVETITPVVHGGRRSRWAVLLALHTAGATAAAATFGAVLGGMGFLLGAPWGDAALVVVAAAAGVYLLGEAFGLRVPVPQLRRQVPDWWRSFFSFGGAAFLYGLGLGVGFFTYLARGTLVVVAAAAASSGSPWVGALLLAPFGLLRGLSAIVALRSRTPEQGSALVERLARSASWFGWRVAHILALAVVLVTSMAALADGDAEMELGALAAAVLAVAFGMAGLSKVARRLTWRRALTSYALPASVERAAVVGVPVIELGVTTLVLLGFASTAGLASLLLLVAFSIVIVLGRLRLGTRLDCGCFGSEAARDYRALLGRNVALAVAAAVAWRLAVDEPVAGRPAAPRGADLIPAVLVLAGLGLAIWVGVQAMALVRRGSEG